MLLDPGAEVTYNDKTLRGGFKVPSLRNIEKTAPYMHSGNFGTLRETVQFYTDGRGHAVPKKENLVLSYVLAGSVNLNENSWLKLFSYVLYIIVNSYYFDFFNWHW